MTEQAEQVPSPMEALKSLIRAIDFEGADGAIHFNPGTPWELDVLRDARAAVATAEGR